MYPILLVVAAFGSSLLLTLLVRNVALSTGLLDVPNTRSSHELPTPRGGGIAVVVSTMMTCSVLAAFEAIDAPLLEALVGGGALVAGVGFIDDRWSLPAGTRLAVHFAAATWAIWSFGGVPSFSLGSRLVTPGIPGDIAGVVVIVWALNLFNFMDGIDGIAASEAICVSWGGGISALLVGKSGTEPVVAFAFGAACLGFLIWNWPKAKIFLGDVGSGYIGYAISVLALAASRDNPAAPWVWGTLGAAFIIDATVTVVRRFCRGEHIFEAHRTHAYQWLARRWKSHRRVTIMFIAINTLWLFPIALLGAVHPQLAARLATIAFATLIPLALLAGSGRLEEVARNGHPDTRRSFGNP